MNTLKYFSYLSCLLCCTLLFSCSDDEGEAMPEDTWEGAQVGLFAEDARPIEVPQAMLQSEDPHAWVASSYIAQSTMFAVYGSLFTIPEQATKRSTPITAPNGRIAATDYWVYEWGTDTVSIAYQFYSQNGQENFELFINPGNGYLKWMEVVQDKDGHKGSLKLFEETGETAVWTWEIKDDESYLLTFHSSDYHYEIISNKDLSGSIKSYSDGTLDMEMEWDSAGNGSWKEYDAGNLTDEGTWTV